MHTTGWSQWHSQISILRSHTWQGRCRFCSRLLLLRGALWGHRRPLPAARRQTAGHVQLEVLVLGVPPGTGAGAVTRRWAVCQRSLLASRGWADCVPGGRRWGGRKGKTDKTAGTPSAPQSKATTRASSKTVACCESQLRWTSITPAPSFGVKNARWIGSEATQTICFPKYHFQMQRMMPYPIKSRHPGVSVCALDVFWYMLHFLALEWQNKAPTLGRHHTYHELSSQSAIPKKNSNGNCGDRHVPSHLCQY